MTDADRSKKQEVLRRLRDNPYLTQQELADQLGMTRSAIAAYIVQLTKEGEILGRAYRFRENRRFLCIGGANIDRKIQSIGVLTLGTSNPSTMTETHGGVARNVAENLARLGEPPILITAIGTDHDGEPLIHHLSSLGVHTHAIMRKETEHTGTYTAILDNQGDMVVACADMAIYDAITVEDLRTRESVMRQAGAIIIDTNLRQDLITYLIDFAKASMISLTIVPVSVPKAKHIPYDLQGVDHLIANRDELYAIAYQHPAPEKDDESDHDSLLEACQIIAQRGCQEVIITSGAKGVFAYDASTQTFSHLPAQQATIIDVTGAGDAFAAAYSYARFHGEKMLFAIRFATEMAAITLATQETVASRLTPELAREFLMNCRKIIHEERQP